MGICASKQKKNNYLPDNKNNLAQKEEDQTQNIQEKQEVNLKEEQGQLQEYPSQNQKEILYSDKMEKNIQEKSDQEIQEFIHKLNYINNQEDNQLKVKKQSQNLSFQQTACSTHQNLNLVFLNINNNVNKKLTCYQCYYEQQIQKENLFMLEQFFTLSEKEYLNIFLKYESDETRQIFENLFGKNYGQQYSKMHIDALSDFKDKIIKYIDDQIKQISQAMQKFQKIEENLKQQYYDCNQQQSFQQILSYKFPKAQDLETKISTLLKDQSKNFQKFESDIKEYKINLFKEINQQGQIIQNFQNNIIDFTSKNNKLTINYPKEFENLPRFQISSQIASEEEFQMIQKWIGDKFIRFNKIYSATYNGFQIENIYQQCKDKKKVILLIKTTSNYRFGFYSDLYIKDYGGKYVAQNPNNIFIFCLDRKQKYTSNESNCQYAFYSSKNYLGLGGGIDLLFYTNSNTDNRNYVNSYSYGNKEGLTGNDLNRGTRNFSTNEIEIFEVINI